MISFSSAKLGVLVAIYSVMSHLGFLLQSSDASCHKPPQRVASAFVLRRGRDGNVSSPQRPAGTNGELPRSYELRWVRSADIGKPDLLLVS
ncbi:hypothetical protein C8Q74DRAFT_1284172 [Fomes fomentarius]|nr:hypothetical protein C8Q74DRAFT_1284172 [Fomes fomentarius]